MTTEKLSAAERADISNRRVAALLHGAGDHSGGHRDQAIAAAQQALKEALADLRKETAGSA